MSLISNDGSSLEDITLENRTVCLKVYTIADDTIVTGNKNIAVDYDGGEYFSVKVVTADGHMLVRVQQLNLKSMEKQPLSKQTKGEWLKSK